MNFDEHKSFFTSDENWQFRSSGGWIESEEESKKENLLASVRDRQTETE